MKKSQRQSPFDALRRRVGVVPNQVYDQLLYTVGSWVNTGTKELRARAGVGLSRLRSQLDIPTHSELAQLRDRIATLEKKIKFEQHVA